MRDNYGYFEGDKAPVGFGDFRLWRRILDMGRPYWQSALLAVLLSLLVVVCGLALPYLIRQAIDTCILNHQAAMPERLSQLGLISLAFAGLMVLEFLGTFVQVLVLEWTGQKTMHRIRQQAFFHLLGLDLAFFHRHPAGRLVTRLTNDIQNLHEMFTSVLVILFNDGIKLAGILLVLFWLDWRLALGLCLLLPPLALHTLWFSRLARDAFRSLRSRLSLINAFLQEALSGMALVQLFLQEDNFLQKFSRFNRDFLAKAFDQIRLFAVFMPLTELLSSVASALILWYGGSRVMAGELSIGTLVAFLAYVRLFFQPIRELSQKYSIVQSALASAERVFDLLDTRSALSLPASPKRPDWAGGCVEFIGVDFGYDKKQPVLRDFHLRIPAGRTLAIVGATGSGKSTIINLLLRFYDPDRGAVLLDGTDLRELDPVWLRRQVGLVMQDVLLLPASLRANILLDGGGDEGELPAIIEKVGLACLVSRLPEGLETKVGEGGVDLSAGERQLVAFARALARRSRILVLDEASSSVDPESELLIEQAMETSFAGRTNIVIAHRLSTIRRADHILVMEQGRIIEEGSPAELTTANGAFRRLLDLDLVPIG